MNPISFLRRRQYARFKVDAHAALVLNDKTKKALKLKDISAEGLSGIGDCYLDPGERVEVILLDPFFENFIRKETKVIWCEKINEDSYALGLSFGFNKIELSNHAVARGARYEG